MPLCMPKTPWAGSPDRSRRSEADKLMIAAKYSVRCTTMGIFNTESMLWRAETTTVEAQSPCTKLTRRQSSSFEQELRSSNFRARQHLALLFPCLHSAYRSMRGKHILEIAVGQASLMLSRKQAACGLSAKAIEPPCCWLSQTGANLLCCFSDVFLKSKDALKAKRVWALVSYLICAIRRRGLVYRTLYSGTLSCYTYPPKPFKYIYCFLGGFTTVDGFVAATAGLLVAASPEVARPCTNFHLSF